MPIKHDWSKANALTEEQVRGRPCRSRLPAADRSAIGPHETGALCQASAVSPEISQEEFAARFQSGPVGKANVGFDHKHRLRSVRPYDYQDAATLLADFWHEVEIFLHEKGIVL